MIRSGGNKLIRFRDDLAKTGLGWVRDKDYLKWVRTVSGGKDPHHVLGSVSKRLKSTDYIVVPLSRGLEHDHADSHREEMLEIYLPVAFRLLISYLIYKKGSSEVSDNMKNLDPLEVDSWVTLIKEVK